MPPILASEPQTDREYLMQLAIKFDNLSEAMDRVATAIERMENNKFEPLEKRVSSLEKWQSQENGVKSFVKYLITFLVGLGGILIGYLSKQ